MIEQGRRCCSSQRVFLGGYSIQIVSMLSVPPPFMRPRDALKSADKVHRAFASGHGDHLTQLASLAKKKVLQGIEAGREHGEARERHQLCGPAGS